MLAHICGVAIAATHRESDAIREARERKKISAAKYESMAEAVSIRLCGGVFLIAH